MALTIHKDGLYVRKLQLLFTAEHMKNASSLQECCRIQICPHVREWRCYLACRCPLPWQLNKTRRMSQEPRLLPHKPCGKAPNVSLGNRFSILTAHSVESYTRKVRTRSRNPAYMLDRNRRIATDSTSAECRLWDLTPCGSCEKRRFG
jgi:hypothetical protein